MTDWTNPRTWSIGELVTKAIMDTHIRDNLIYLKEQFDVIGDLSTTLKLINRQGGSATDWDSDGVTTYSPENVKIQVGVTTFTVPDTSTIRMQNTITFPTAYSNNPIVFCSVISDSNFSTGGAYSPTSQSQVIDETSAYIRIKSTFNFNISTVIDVAWIAIGI